MNTQFTAQQTANILQISLRTLESLVKSNKGPAFYRIGKLRRWNPLTLQKWIDDQAQDTTSLKIIDGTTSEIADRGNEQ